MGMLLSRHYPNKEEVKVVEKPVKQAPKPRAKKVVKEDGTTNQSIK